MRNRILIVAALVLGMSVSVRLSAQESGGAQPVIEIPTVRFDFGQVFEQKEYAHTFKVYNRGKADLVIEDVKPG